METSTLTLTPSQHTLLKALSQGITSGSDVLVTTKLTKSILCECLAYLKEHGLVGTSEPINLHTIDQVEMWIEHDMHDEVIDLMLRFDARSE